MSHKEVSGCSNSPKRLQQIVSHFGFSMPADSKSPLPAPAAIVASPVAGGGGGGGGAAAKAKSDQKSVAGAAVLWSAGIPSDVLSSFTVDGIRDLGDGLIVRRLAITDYARGYTKLLSQLTTTGNITREEFEARFRLMAAAGCYLTFVIEDTTKNLIIATATLLIERKFTHHCGTIGHVEDVVVNSTYRGKNLGIRVMESLKMAGAAMGCYKIILDCSVDNTSFYSKLGFVQKEVQMAIYYPEPTTTATAAAAN